MRSLNKPMMRNHIIGHRFDDMTDLMNYLRTNKTIYVREMNRVMPCKFFMNWAWLKSKKFAQYFYNGDFYPSTRKDEVSRKRIRKILNEDCNMCSTLNYIATPSINYHCDACSLP